MPESCSSWRKQRAQPIHKPTNELAIGVLSSSSSSSSCICPAPMQRVGWSPLYSQITQACASAWIEELDVIKKKRKKRNMDGQHDELNLKRADGSDDQAMTIAVWKAASDAPTGYTIHVTSLVDPIAWPCASIAPCVVVRPSSLLVLFLVPGRSVHLNHIMAPSSHGPASQVQPQGLDEEHQPRRCHALVRLKPRIQLVRSPQDRHRDRATDAGAQYTLVLTLRKNRTSL